MSEAVVPVLLLLLPPAVLLMLRLPALVAGAAFSELLPAAPLRWLMQPATCCPFSTCGPGSGPLPPALSSDSSVSSSDVSSGAAAPLLPLALLSQGAGGRAEAGRKAPALSSHCR